MALSDCSAPFDFLIIMLSVVHQVVVCKFTSVEIMKFIKKKQLELHENHENLARGPEVPENRMTNAKVY